MERGHTNGRMVPPPHEYDNRIHPHEYVNRIHSWLKMWGRQSFHYYCAKNNNLPHISDINFQNND